LILEAGNTYPRVLKTREVELVVDVNWTLLLPREAQSVGKARRMLRDTADLAGMDPDIVFDLGVALTEACANVIEHSRPAEGYGQRTPDGSGQRAPDGYWVAAGISAERCWVDVIDNGVGFAPRRLVEVRGQRIPTAVPNPAEMADMAESGRGLMLIEALCDRVDIRNHPARGAMIHFERDLKPRESLAA
jgi:serine/threonine-protein kinase RsbW